MHHIYHAFITYALTVVGAISAYAERVSHWPARYAIGFPVAVLFGIDLLLPRFFALLIFAAIGVPLAWFIAAMIGVYFTHYRR